MAQRESEREGGSKRRGKSRRDPRGTRLWTYAAGLFAVLLILVAALPTIVCSTPLLDFAMQRAVASSEWKIKASKLQVGWFTSFEASELELQGPSGATQIKIASVSSELKLLDLLRGASDYGTIQLQGLQLQTGLLPGMTSLEADLAKFNSSSSGDGTESSTSSGHYAIRLQLQNGDVSIVDPQGQIWKCGDINGSVLYESFGVEQKAVGQLAIVLQDPSQQSGKADLQFALDPTTAQQPAMWNGHLSADSLPLSFLQLAAVRVPALAEQLPRDLRGLTTGELRAAGTLAGDTIQLNANPLTIANLSANDARYSAKPWFVQQACVEGVMQWWQGNLSGNPLRITTDFTTTELNGIVAFDRLFGSMQNQLTALAGDLDVRVDVAKFNQALPGLLPLREEAQLTAGTARLVAKAANDSQGLPRLEINADTEQISGTTYGKQVSLPPTTLNLILRPTHGWPKAENLELRSVFANASASGEMQKGHAKFDLDLGRLAEFIKPLVDMPDLRLEGQAAGQLNWALEEGERWQLSGRANGSRLAFKLPGGGSLVEEMLEVAVSAGGIWRNDSLAELSAATVRLSDNGQQWKVDLRQPIQQPSAGSALPIVAAGNGQLSALRQLLGPWLPAEIGDAEGTFIANVQATLGANKLQLANSTVELQQAAVLYDNQLYRPETVTMVFDGEAILPETSLVMRSLKINSPAAAAEVRGQWLPETPPKFEAAYRVDLRRLGEIIGVDSAPAGTLAVRPASAVGAMTPAPTTVWFHGDVAGTASVSGSAEKYNLQINADATNLTVLQLTPPEATAGQVLPPTSPPPQMLWHEKLMHFEGLVAMDPTFSQYVAENLKIKGDWFDSLIVGKATMGENSSTTAGLDGKLTIDTAMLAQRLEPLIGQHLVLSGTHTGPIQATYESDANNSRWNATAELGWQSGQLASLELGPAKIALKADEKQLQVMPTSIPLRNGKLQLAGTATYQPSPMTIEVPPGLVAETVKLDADLCRGWMKFIAPVVADATSVNGQFSLQLDKTLYVPSAPEQSIIQGQLKIAGAELGPGPLSGEIFGLIESIKAATKGQQTAGPANVSGQWIRLPEQTVEFAMRNGFVEHRNMVFESGNVQIATSGTVGLDGNLNMVAVVPLNEKWLGEDPISRSLVGQTLQLPIDGNLSKPSLDSRSVRSMLTQLGTQTIERAGSNLLNRTLERGFEKLLRQK